MSVSGCSIWLPMWVFDGNGFTMVCLAVWIGNIVLCGVFSNDDLVVSGGCDGIQRLQSRFARISVATPGTDFTAPERDFAALIRAAGFCRSGLDRVCPAGLYVS